MTAMDNATRNAGDMINKADHRIQPAAARPAITTKANDRNHLRRGRRSERNRRGNISGGDGQAWSSSPPPTGTDKSPTIANQRPRLPGHRRRRRRAVRRPPAGDLNALKPRNGGNRLVSKSPASGRNTVRTIAMDSDRRPRPRPGSDRHRRRSRCRSATEETLGRIMNVIGEPIDEAGPWHRRHRAIHRRRRPFVDQSTGSRKSSSPASRSSTCCAVRQGRQDRPVRRRRRRQDRAIRN